MLKKALNKLHISKIEAQNEGRRAESSTKTGRDPLGKLASGLVQDERERTQDETLSQPPLFSLPLDILNIILRYLSFQDRISLSLTTRGFSHIRPRVCGPGESNDRIPDYLRKREPLFEAQCASKIVRRMLIKTPSGPSIYASDPGPYICPYCRHKLCSPRYCNTTLFLDSTTGIFFPPALYPVESATFKYSTPQQIFRTEEEIDKDVPDRQGTSYSTIWCEHHRCPRDLISNEGKYFEEKNDIGAVKFLNEHADRKRWLAVRLNRPLGEELRTRFLIGERRQYPLYLLAAAAGMRASAKKDRPRWGIDYKTEMEKKAWWEPVYERTFYESLCRHCFLPIKYPRNWTWKSRYEPWSEVTCTCKTRPKFAGGCHRCGIVSVKFTMVEVFDVFRDRAPGEHSDIYNIHRRSFFLYLATEYKLVTMKTGPEKLRMLPADATGMENSLRIVRGIDVRLMRQPRVGFQDLPYRVVLWIFTLHNRSDETKNESNDASARYHNSADGEAPAAAGKTFPILELPLDIIIIILGYLNLRDQIFLSLTTRKLYYLLDKEKHLRCSVNGQNTPCARQHYQRGDMLSPSLECEEALDGGECQFCLKPMCLPSCEMALMLDVITGIFFPAYLYPLNTAKFLRYPEGLDTYIKFESFMNIDYQWRFGAFYSTIWCEHHRCPRDLLSSLRESKDNKPSFKRIARKFTRETPPHILPALRYEFECLFRIRYKYRSPVVYLFHENSMKGRLLAGFENPATGKKVSASAASGSKQISGENGSLLEQTKGEPVYERLFYSIYCLHCCRTVDDTATKRFAERMNYFQQYPNKCRCGELKQRRRASGWFANGCHECGVATVKFTMVEAFDFYETPSYKEVNSGDELAAYASAGGREGLEHRGRHFVATECVQTSQRVVAGVSTELRPGLSNGGYDGNENEFAAGNSVVFKRDPSIPWTRPDPLNPRSDDPDNNTVFFCADGQEVRARGHLAFGQTVVTAEPTAKLRGRRIIALDLARTDRWLGIVRGRNIIKPTPPKIGITELPSSILNNILRNLAEYDEKSGQDSFLPRLIEVEGRYELSYKVLAASYSFLKAWFGDLALNAACTIHKREDEEGHSYVLKPLPNLTLQGTALKYELKYEVGYDEGGLI
ncbi:hypothetical protein H072_9098 [Dactylellina haptotyla CBS 200.50]|uniref:F-box domain-containing protein n=1 Tax=Dactylellina haptotyla (strain CBS 200.50) TaxID=1284197 RepID=S8A3C4_DACHA|nr:hypothetical protein H072_9098 [Dactylellina haptotyla CBS 200.50]